MNQELTFNETLYEAMKFVHPALTTRLFSVACLGRCESYWSSVVSQGLKVPNTALLSLYDYLEAKKIVSNDKPLNVRVINDIQEMIEDEIVSRFQQTNQISKAGWDRLSQSIREESADEKYGFLNYMRFGYIKYGY